jgi:hypothetical protein
VVEGGGWDSEDVVEFIRANQNSLPHLREVLIAFFQAALKTWEEFTKIFVTTPR